MKLKNITALMLVGLSGLFIGVAFMAYYDTKALQSLVTEAKDTIKRVQAVEARAKEKLQLIEKGQKAFCGATI